jgi:hypothetical protein
LQLGEKKLWTGKYTKYCTRGKKNESLLHFCRLFLNKSSFSPSNEFIFKKSRGFSFAFTAKKSPQQNVGGILSYNGLTVAET